VLDRDYTIIDVPLENIKTTAEYGLPEEFYGGSITHIAKVKDSPVLLLINNDDEPLKVVDVATPSLDDIDYNTLKKYAKSKGIAFDKESATKEKLYDMVKSIVVEV
jgi:hypothetical protein